MSVVVGASGVDGDRRLGVVARGALGTGELAELGMANVSDVVDGKTEVSAAMAIMLEQSLSSVFVDIEPGTIGIVTERDIVTNVVAQESDVDHVHLQEVMHPDPDSLGMEDELVYALHQMSNEGGGVSDVLRCGHQSKRELSNRLSAFIAGIETAKG